MATSQTVYTSGEVILAAAMNTNFGQLYSLQRGSVATDPGGLMMSDAGTQWFNTTDNQFKGWNGSAVVILG